MLQHLVKLIVRTLRKKILYSSVTLTGISVSILTAGLVYMYVRHELGYDRFHENAGNIYRVDSHFHMPKLANPDFRFPSVSAPLVDKIRAELPGIVHSTRFMKSFGPDIIVQSQTDAFAEKLTFVDNDFFETFSFKLLKGSKTTPFQNSSSIILTESVAKKYFGNADPLGKELIAIENNTTTNYTVTGVVVDPPSNSSITFQLLVPIESWGGYNDVSSLWNEHNYSFFVRLGSEVDSSAFQAGLDKVVETTSEPIVSRKDSYRAKLTPLTEMHWNMQVPWDQTSDSRNITILISIVLIVVVIACANFVTISIVNSSSRTTEIGIKKIVGAGRWTVIFQFMGESLVMTILGGIIGLVLMVVLLPYFSAVIGRSLQWRFDLIDVSFIGGLVVLISMLAGFYPAILFSRYSPGQILKGNAITRTRSSIVFVLVLFQFCLLLFLGGCSFIMTRQMAYINNRDLGFDHDQVIVVPTFSSDADARSVVSKFKSEAAREPMILSVASCSSPFFKGISRMGYGGERSARAYNVDADFLTTLGIKVEDGRDFNPNSPGDSQAVIVNRELALEISDNPLNETIEWGLDQSSEIIGITGDFNYESLEFPVQPLILTMSNAMQPPSTLLVKVSSNDIAGALARIEAIFKTTNPGKPFQYNFLSDSVDKLYSSYRMWTTIVTLANIFIAFIACVGLFGLAGVEVTSHYKEIGIRKVFGATSRQILYRVGRRYLLLIAIAAIVSIPVSYNLMSDWISQFAFKIDVTWQAYTIIIIGGVLTTLFAVGYHCLRGANINPAETLKHRD